MYNVLITTVHLSGVTVSCICTVFTGRNGIRITTRTYMQIAVWQSRPIVVNCPLGPVEVNATFDALLKA